ncbi:MAG: DUF4160 domain-containing protein [Phycisphaerales bacterium]
MPTILHDQGFRFQFYSADGSEPPHIHVHKAGNEAKWWLDPLREAWCRGYTRAERARVARLVKAHQGYLLRRWYESFRKD